MIAHRWMITIDVADREATDVGCAAVFERIGSHFVTCDGK
jgi:hypothetical protein